MYSILRIKPYIKGAIFILQRLGKKEELVTLDVYVSLVNGFCEF